MAFTKVGEVGDVPPGEVKEVRAGGRPYAVCNAEGEIHVLDGPCPHLGGPLGQGALDGNMLVCPWHAWEFDCRTGVNDRSPDVKVPKVAVKIEDDDILIDAG